MAKVKALITQKHQTFAIFEDSNFEATVADMVDRIEVSASGKDVSWMQNLTQYMSAVADVGQKTLLMQAAMLSTVKRLWEEEKITPEITSQWEGVFWNWAKYVSLRGAEPPTDVTLQNQISVYEFYFERLNQENGFCLPPSLQYTVTVIDDDGKEIEQDVVVESPSLYQAAYGKLLVAKGLAVKAGGNLSDKTVALMLNPDITVRVFKEQLKIERIQIEGPVVFPDLGDSPSPQNGDAPQMPPSDVSDIETVTGIEMGQDTTLYTDNQTTDSPELDLSALDAPAAQGVFYQNGMFMYQQDGLTLPAFITPTGDEGGPHPLTSVGQQYILGRFGIYDERLDSSVEPIGGPPVEVTNGGMVLLNLNGYHFAELDANQVRELLSGLGDALVELAEQGETGDG